VDASISYQAHESPSDTSSTTLHLPEHLAVIVDGSLYLISICKTIYTVNYKASGAKQQKEDYKLQISALLADFGFIR
jgi:hypothetical protein